MTVDAAIVLCLKVALISGFMSLTGWIAVYTWLTRGGAWKNPIGLTLVVKTLLIAALFVPTALSLFFHLNKNDSRMVGWIDFALIALVTPVMWWRTAVWVRLGRLGRLPSNGNGKQGEPDGAS